MNGEAGETRDPSQHPSGGGEGERGREGQRNQSETERRQTAVRAQLDDLRKSVAGLSPASAALPPGFSASQWDRALGATKLDLFRREGLRPLCLFFPAETP